MNLKKFILYLFSVACLLGSCKPVSYFTVELTEPPPERLSEEIQSLVLVDRAVDSLFTNDPEDSIQLRFYKAQFDIDTVICDIKAADSLLQALGNLLYESGRFDIVIPEERFLKKDSSSAFPVELDWGTAEMLTETFSTDAVLSLEHFRTTVSARFGRTVTGYSAYQDIYEQVYAARMKIGYAAVFRLYYPNSKQFTPSYLISDTLTWEDFNPDIKALFRSFTSVKAGLAEAGIAAALKISGEIAPGWKSTKRAYFGKGNKILAGTSPLVLSNDWIQARQLWMESLEITKSRQLRSKVEFNIALASEMLGEIDEAIRWGLQSYQTYFRTITYNYLDTLKKRKAVLNRNKIE